MSSGVLAYDIAQTAHESVACPVVSNGSRKSCSIFFAGFVASLGFESEDELPVDPLDTFRHPTRAAGF